jgi:hypothetical protein
VSEDESGHTAGPTGPRLVPWEPVLVCTRTRAEALSGTVKSRNCPTKPLEAQTSKGTPTA